MSEFSGYSYEKASRKAMELITNSAKQTENWYLLPEKLIELREIMQTTQKVEVTSDLVMSRPECVYKHCPHPSECTTQCAYQQSKYD